MLSNDKIFQVILRDADWLQKGEYTNHELVFLGNSFFQKHCNQTMAIYRIQYNHNCSTHKETHHRKYYVCRCPACTDITIDHSY